MCMVQKIVILRTYELVSTLPRYHVSHNLENTILFVLRSILLRYLVSEERRLLDSNKIKLIAKFSPPENVPKMRSTLGHIEWSGEAIEDYANTIVHLTNLTKKMFHYLASRLSKCEGKFTIVPYFISPSWDLPFNIYCDASNFAVDDTLCQLFREE